MNLPLKKLCAINKQNTQHNESKKIHNKSWTASKTLSGSNFTSESYQTQQKNHKNKISKQTARVFAKKQAGNDEHLCAPNEHAPNPHSKCRSFFHIVHSLARSLYFLTRRMQMSHADRKRSKKRLTRGGFRGCQTTTPPSRRGFRCAWRPPAGRGGARSRKRCARTHTASPPVEGRRIPWPRRPRSPCSCCSDTSCWRDDPARTCDHSGNKAETI